MDPLLSVDELDELREIGESMMATSVQILRSITVSVGEAGYDPIYLYGDAASQYDYGDDAVLPMGGFDGSDYPEEAVIATTTGWFVSHLQTEVQQGTGEIATVDLHVVRMPVGTNVRPDDTLRVIGPPMQDYHVVDVNDDDTWPEWLKANVRRAE